MFLLNLKIMGLLHPINLESESWNRKLLWRFLSIEDSGHYNGFPYSIPGRVFDEYDLEGCGLSKFVERYYNTRVLPKY